MPDPGATLLAWYQTDARPDVPLQFLYTLLLGLFLLILLLIVLAIVLRQYGRAARRRRERTETKYVDAWQQYRLRDDELAPFEDDQQPPPSGSQ